MPAPAKYKNNSYTYNSHNLYSSDRAYSDRMYTGTSSTAYDIPVRYPRPSVNPKITPDVEKMPNRSKANKKARADRAKITKVVVLAGVLFVLCITVLYRYGIILSCNQQIKELESQKNEILASNQAAQAKIDKQFEMNEIEKYAKENLGMMKPQSYQIFYIDMDMGDEGGDGTIPNTSSGALTGVSGTLVNAFRVLK